MDPERDEKRPPLLLRIPEAAAQLGLGRSTVYELIRDGELPVVRIGTAVRVPAAALDEWLRQRLADQAGVR